MAHSDAIAAQRELLSIMGERVASEPKTIDYDANLHPGMLRRGMMAGFTIDRMAAVFGVREETLRMWMQVHPAMFEAGKEVLMKDAEVVDSLYELAIGWTDPETGMRTKPNAQALMFIAKTRLGFRESDGREEKTLKDMTPDQIMEMVRILEGVASDATTEKIEHATDVTDEGGDFSEFD